MKKPIIFFGLVIILIACTPVLPNLETTTTNHTGTTTLPASKPATLEYELIPTFTAQETPTPTFSPRGWLLLLQTNTSTYHWIDVKTSAMMPFNLPDVKGYHPLASNLSPSGQKMLFQIQDNQVVVFNLLSNRITHTIDLDKNSNVFDANQTAQIAHPLLSDLDISFESVLFAIQDAYTQSKQLIRWYQSDQFQLFVAEGSETSTNLFLHDFQTGAQTQLEQMPGLVEGFWLSPGSDYLLVKKGYIFDSLTWQDDTYYLVNNIDQVVRPILLPADVENPNLFWFSQNEIGIIHKSQLVGGENFSLINVNSMESRLVLSGSFSGLYSYGDSLLTLHQDQNTRTTSLTLYEINGQTVANREIEELCFLKQIIDGNSLLLNCETKSILVEKNGLQISIFGDPIFIYASAPNKNNIIMVTRNYETALMSEELHLQDILQLEGEPLEIFWLPDSSGFLYRTARILYFYDLEARTNNHVIQSDLFGDYRNINAVWVNFQE